jgi:CheY-like chemotaxis protein
MASSRILIVEDEQSIAGLLKSSLEKCGYNIVGSVATGEEAIWEAHKHQPDLILMDIHLTGGMDGIEAATQIRLNSRIPAIFVTGDMEDGLLEQAKAAEPLGFVLKPFTAKELQRTIETSLNSYLLAQKRNKEALQDAEDKYQAYLKTRLKEYSEFPDGAVY